MEQWQRLNQWFEARERREKLLIILTSLALVWLLLMQFWVAPAQERLQQSQLQLQQRQTEYDTLSQELQYIQQQTEQNPAAQMRQQAAELELRLQRLQQKVSQAAPLMTAGSAVDWMQSLLAADEAVQITFFDTLPAQPVAGNGDAQPLLYQHRVEVRLEGSYLALRNYVERIDSLPYSFHWQNLRYEVANYPRAQLSLILYSLSTSEEFVGV